MAFEGFSDRTIDFMWGIRLNNNREWFLEHKQEYLDHFYHPMQELTKDVWAKMQAVLPEGTHIHLSRIYRDVRRAREGDGPYKDSLWFNIRRDYEGDWMEAPALFFEIHPEGYFCGLVTLYCRPETMRRFRERIDATPAAFERIALELAKLEGFHLSDETYKKKKGEYEGVMSDWYNCKRHAFYSETAPNPRMMSRALVDDICATLKRCLPLYDYLWQLYL